MTAFASPHCCGRAPAALALLAVLALVGGPAPSLAQPKAEAPVLPSDLALVPGTAYAFVSVRVADLYASPLVAKLLPAFGMDRHSALAELLRALPLPPNEIERATLVASTQNEPVLIAYARKAYDRDKLVKGLPPTFRETKNKDRAFFAEGKRGLALHLLDGRTILKGPIEGIHALLDGKPGTAGPLASARGVAAGKHHVVVGLRPLSLVGSRRAPRAEKAVAPDRTPDKVEELKKPELKKPEENKKACVGEVLEVEGKGEPRPSAREADEQAVEQMPAVVLPYKPLVQARSVTLTLDLGMEIEVGAIFDYADEATARDGVLATRTALYVLREGLPLLLADSNLPVSEKGPVASAVKKAQASLRAAKVERSKTVVQARASCKVDPVTLAGVIVELRKAGASVRQKNNLRMLTIAMHQYHDTYRGLPAPAIYGKDGKALLSWRVAILPYVEQNALYQQFHLDEPWDSAHNKKLLAKMPDVFAPPPGVKAKGHHTFLRVFTGRSTVFPEPAVKAFKGPSVGLSLVRIPDGTSNTLMIVEAAESVPWTKPDELPYDDKKALPKLGALPNHFLAAFADGSVVTFDKKIPEKVLRLLITADDGNFVNWDEWAIPRRNVRPGRRPGGGTAPAKSADPKGESPTPLPPPLPPPPKK